ncbi:MAG TPA: saccharopine dehydrogenase NADP-binding domain-containing protein [Haliangium sp.]|nr:saccharopine dehydrogenase NADP-binding domain-containing protein [Haliangium sp.]
MSILVYGATGFTGTLVARALRARGMDLVLSGRDAGRLDALAENLAGHGAGGLEVRPAALHDDAALARAMSGVEMAVACAGPFTRLGEPVVAAAVQAGVPVLDVAGEQEYLRAIYERFESPARKRGVLVLSGMGLEIALGDLGAHVAARAAAHTAIGAAPGPEDAPRVDEVCVAYALNRFPPTTGTRMAAIDALSQPGWVWIGDRWDPVPPLHERRVVNFGPGMGERATLSFPSGEVMTVPRHVHARRVQTFLSLLDTGPFGDVVTRVARLVSPFVPALVRTAVGAQLRAQIGTGAPDERPSETDRKFATFAVACEARLRFEDARLVVSGHDPYGVTAEIAAWAVETLRARMQRSLLPMGVRTPSEIFAPEETLEALIVRCDLDAYRSF